MPARASGKVKAWIYAFAGGAGIVVFALQTLDILPEIRGWSPTALAFVLFLAAAGVALWSLGDYGWPVFREDWLTKSARKAVDNLREMWLYYIRLKAYLSSGFEGEGGNAVLGQSVREALKRGRRSRELFDRISGKGEEERVRDVRFGERGKREDARASGARERQADWGCEAEVPTVQASLGCENGSLNEV